jgi:glucan phosphoethanolaminetransferase (alkaline phosphatase superfamily)
MIMDDKFTKYSKLYVLIFLLFLSIPVAFGLIIGVMYGFSTIVSSSYVDILFELVVISLPAAVFSTAYFIFFRRTKKHPSAVVKIISQILFLLGFCYCITIMGISIRDYFTVKPHDITKYATFSLLFLAGNIALLFFLAIIQAFTTKKEEDWMAKRKRLEDQQV